MSDPDANTSSSVPATVPADTVSQVSPAKPTPTKKESVPATGSLDLSSLKIMPAWVADFGKTSTTPIRDYSDSERSRGDRRDRHSDDRGRGGFGGDRSRGAKPGFRSDRPPGQGGGGPGMRPDRPRSEGEGGRRRDGGGGDRFRDQRRDRPSGPPREWVDLPKGIHVSVYPEDKSLDALASHIRATGHAFSLFDVARLVLAGNDRFGVRFHCDENRPEPLFSAPDGALFLTREEVSHHILGGPALATFYRVEETELEEPKGNFPSVSLCGLSGTVLGPASHHSFQTALIRIHRERYSQMPLEDYKRRIRTDSNPDLIQQWKDEQRKGLRWIPLQTSPAEGTEPEPLLSRHEMEAHFRLQHSATAATETRDVTVPGNIDKASLSPALFIMLRQAVDAARKHLFEMSQKLSAGFDRRGLKTFKRRAGKMFVSRVRPRAIDPGTVFSERVTAIVERLRHAPGGVQVSDLMQGIVSTAAEIEPPVPETHPATAAVEAPPERCEDQAATPPPESSQPSEAPAPPQLTDEQLAAVKDLRWLVNEGFLIEYADGLVCLGVQGDAAPHPKKEIETRAPGQPKKPAMEEASTETKEPSKDLEEIPPPDAAISDSPSEQLLSQLETSAEQGDTGAVAFCEPLAETEIIELPAASPPDAGPDQASLSQAHAEAAAITAPTESDSAASPAPQNEPEIESEPDEGTPNPANAS